MIQKLLELLGSPIADRLTGRNMHRLASFRMNRLSRRPDVNSERPQPPQLRATRQEQILSHQLQEPMQKGSTRDDRKPQLLGNGIRQRFFRSSHNRGNSEDKCLILCFIS
jgi:hypothetical protein